MNKLMKTTDKLDKVIDELKSSGVETSVIHVTPKTYAALLLESGNHVWDKKPKPPMNGYLRGSFTQGGLFNFGYGSIEGATYDYHAPEYLRALAEYELKEKEPRHMFYMGIKILVREDGVDLS